MPEWFMIKVVAALRRVGIPARLEQDKIATDDNCVDIVQSVISNWLFVYKTIDMERKQ